MKKKQKGFTLIELLVVVAIIGILAAVGVVAYSGYTSSAKKSAAKSNHAAVLKYVAAEMKMNTYLILFPPNILVIYDKKIIQKLKKYIVISALKLNY